MGGHGNSMGGILVDGGTFDWSKSGNYPMLSEPRPEYNGIVLHQIFGNFAFAIAARVLGLRDFGPSISPFNAFQLLTGIETLPLRMQRHCENALQVASWLKAHEKVSWVSYSGLPDDPNNALQKRYSPRGAGAVFTFGLKGAMLPARPSWKASSSSRISPISATRARWSSTRPRPRTSS